MHQPQARHPLLNLSRLPQAIGLYLVVALLTRGWTFGNPVIHVDEQFYLLVGQHMLQGEWPYKEIFDRKPFLLFAINAGFALFGAHALIVSQLAASAAAVLTAAFLRQIAIRVVSPGAAILPGAFYIALLPGFEGIGAQSPLFYTPLVCGAALLTLKAIEGGRLLAFGCAAMVTSGLALQIKYTIVFECTAFGIALLWSARRRGWTRGSIAGASLLWISLALAPTLLIAAGYTLAGYGDAFWQANVIANLATGSPLHEALPRLAVNLAVLSGALVCAAAGWQRLGQASSGHFIRLWLVAALGGYVLYGTWYTHYMLPVLAPLAVVAAAAFDPGARFSRSLALAAMALTLLACSARGVFLVRQHGSAAQAQAIAAQINDHLRSDGRLFIYAGDPAFYRLTGSNLPNPYVFPDHYSRSSARRFMPLSPPDALRRQFSDPPKVVMRVDKVYPDSDRASDDWLAAELARSYHLFATLPIGSKHVLLYELREK